MHTDIPILNTQNLILRGWRPEDATAYGKMNGKVEFTQFLGDGNTLNQGESWRLMAMIIGHWHLRGFGLWAVEERNTNILVGRVGLWQPEGWPGVEIGWGIDPEHWGKGYATEAARAAMKWAFDILDIDQLISLIHPENEASKKVAFKLNEQFAEQATIQGKTVDIYSITRADYQNAI